MYIILFNKSTVSEPQLCLFELTLELDLIDMGGFQFRFNKITIVFRQFIITH